jgi:hypothetical protein
MIEAQLLLQTHFSSHTRTREAGDLATPSLAGRVKPGHDGGESVVARAKNWPASIAGIRATLPSAATSKGGALHRHKPQLELLTLQYL